jgi:hypothetical protein
MSYKSNRSWTLPTYNVSTNAIIAEPCPQPTGVTVTWTQPDNNDTANVSVICVEYCHGGSDSLPAIGWTELTGSSLSIQGVCNTGYRVCIDFYPLGSGGSMGVCAVDYVCNPNVVFNAGGNGITIPPTYTGPVGAALTGVNRHNNYYFTASN